MKTNTRKLYCRWIYRLDKYYGVSNARLLSHNQVGEYIASLTYQYSQSTINQAIIAINLYYALHGIDYKFKTKSTRGNLRLPQTLLSREDVQLITENLPDFYRPIIDEIYVNLIPPYKAVKLFASRGWQSRPVHIDVLTRYVRRARKTITLPKSATPKTIHQSGIVHYLQDTNDVIGARQKTGLSDERIAYYYRIAFQRKVKSPIDDF